MNNMTANKTLESRLWNRDVDTLRVRCEIGFKIRNRKKTALED